jgi:hypothetical protein
VDQGERAAVIGIGAFLRKSDFGLALNDRDRRSQFVRGIAMKSRITLKEVSSRARSALMTVVSRPTSSLGLGMARRELRF